MSEAATILSTKGHKLSVRLAGQSTLEVRHDQWHCQWQVRIDRVSGSLSRSTVCISDSQSNPNYRVFASELANILLELFGGIYGMMGQEMSAFVRQHQSSAEVANAA